VPKIWGFPLTLIVALTIVLCTTGLHCDHNDSQNCTDIKFLIKSVTRVTVTKTAWLAKKKHFGL